MSRVKWRERKQFTASWRRYLLDVTPDINGKWAATVVPPPAGIPFVSNGYGTPEGAMNAAELAARIHFSKRRK